MVLSIIWLCDWLEPVCQSAHGWLSLACMRDYYTHYARFGTRIVATATTVVNILQLVSTYYACDREVCIHLIAVMAAR